MDTLLMLQKLRRLERMILRLQLESREQIDLILELRRHKQEFGWFRKQALLDFHSREEKRRLRRCRRWFVQTFDDKYIREYVYQFVDKRTADAVVQLEIIIHYPQLHIARTRRSD